MITCCIWVKCQEGLGKDVVVEKNTLLIISDDHMHSTYNSIKIQAAEIKVCAWDQASVCLDEGKADVVVIDCGHKIEKGLRLLKTSKSRHPRVPVILLTDVSSEDHAINAFRSGAREYFRKPVNVLTLQKLLVLLLKAKKSSKQRKLPYHHGYHLTRTESRLPADTTKPASILNAIRFMEEHYDSQLSLDQIAQQARLSKYYFIRHFNTIIIYLMF